MVKYSSQMVDSWSNTSRSQSNCWFMVLHSEIVDSWSITSQSTCWFSHNYQAATHLHLVKHFTVKFFIHGQIRHSQILDSWTWSITSQSNSWFMVRHFKLFKAKFLIHGQILHSQIVDSWSNILNRWFSHNHRKLLTAKSLIYWWIPVGKHFTVKSLWLWFINEYMLGNTSQWNLCDWFIHEYMLGNTSQWNHCFVNK